MYVCGVIKLLSCVHERSCNHLLVGEECCPLLVGEGVRPSASGGRSCCHLLVEGGAAALY